MTNPTLNDAQMAGLRLLVWNPAAFVEPAILSKLRKLALVGKLVGKDVWGKQKTTSPITAAGRAALGLPSA